MKTMSVGMDMPGDWHTGLCIAQSIFNVCYTGVWDEFQDLLGWKRINSKVGTWYYQAICLITFVHDELLHFLTHQFVSQREPSYGKKVPEADDMTIVAK